MIRIRASFADLAWWSLGLLLAAAVFGPPQHVGERLGLRRHLTPQVSDEWRIGQRFRMDAPMLNGVEIRAAAVGPVSGRVRLALQDRDAREVQRSAEVAAAELVREGSYVFRFEPIAKSADHEYQFEIAPAADDPGRGVALWATKGPREEYSALRINNERRWGSLAFQTYTPAVSVFNRLIQADDSARPSAWLALVGLFGGWLALRFVLRAVAAAEPEPTRPAPPAPLAT
jgi:hypothetical protein